MQIFPNIHAQQDNSLSYLDHRVPINKFPTRKMISRERTIPATIDRIPESSFSIPNPFSNKKRKRERDSQPPIGGCCGPVRHQHRKTALDNVDSARVTSAIHNVVRASAPKERSDDGRSRLEEEETRSERTRIGRVVSAGGTTGPINGPNESIIHS